MKQIIVMVLFIIIITLLTACNEMFVPQEYNCTIKYVTTVYPQACTYEIIVPGKTLCDIQHEYSVIICDKMQCCKFTGAYSCWTAYCSNITEVPK